MKFSPKLNADDGMGALIITIIYSFKQNTDVGRCQRAATDGTRIEQGYYPSAHGVLVSSRG